MIISRLRNCTDDIVPINVRAKAKDDVKSIGL